MISPARALLSCCALAMLLGCASARLVPVAPTRGTEARGAASGVEVRANADASQRLWTVPHAFTPVRVSVHNQGQAPIYVSLEDIQLSGERGALRPVPPASIPPRHRVGSLGLEPGSPFVAPQSGSSVFGRSESVVLGPPLGTSFTVPGSHGTGDDIVASAFSGGAIGRGEMRTGIVYFRHVPANLGQRLTLRVSVRPSADQRVPSAVVEIAYDVRT